MNQHHKSLSFLMELLIVIFFFTIASGICVLVMSNAKDKQLYAKNVKTSLIYGQNLIDEENDYCCLVDSIGNGICFCCRNL